MSQEPTPNDARPQAPAPSAYAAAGVDIEAGDRAVELMKESVARTHRPEVLGGLGGFAGFFDASSLAGYKRPVLATSTDGVGTKVAIAQAMDRHDTIGQDLIGMLVDDLVVVGAEPLFVTDYISCGKVVPERIAAIVKGIARGCEIAGAALLGGETAEHPGLLEADEYDIAGATTGVVEYDRILGADRIRPGDVVVAMRSSGLHSNGYSLARKLLFDSGDFNLDDQTKEFANPLGRELLTPSFIYAPAVLKVAEECDVKAVAHITGGGITENLPRVMPDDLNAEVHLGTWPVKNIFTFIQRVGNIDLFEMLRTFNMGLGMMLVVSAGDARKALQVLDMNLYRAYVVGEMAPGKGLVMYR